MYKSSEFLVDLIISLTKSEKRAFRIHATKQGSTDDKLFLLLFDHIDSKGSLDEDYLLKKNPAIKKVQLSNIKAKLYKELMTTLRLLQRSTDMSIQARELMDYAKVMYHKGLYIAGLDIIEKVKKICTEINDLSGLYAAVDFERQIESQFVTGSTFVKANKIIIESNQLISRLDKSNRLSNLSIRLYAHYLRFGYVKDQEEATYLTDLFEEHKPTLPEDDLDFYEKIMLYQAHVWYSNMTQDFSQYFKYSHKWVTAFEHQPIMMYHDYPLYLKGFHNTLNSLYLANKRDKFDEYYEKYKRIEDTVIVSVNTYNASSNYYLYLNVHLLNSIFLKANYDEGSLLLSKLKSDIDSNVYNWDTNRILIFNYKIACIDFGADKYLEALEYLNRIINAPIEDLRHDIHCFARMLALITHFELGNEMYLNYQVKSVYRFLLKMENLQNVQKDIINFLRKTGRIHSKTELMAEFVLLKDQLVKWAEHPIESRPFLYLDIIAWLDSKIKGQRIQTIIQNNILKE